MFDNGITITLRLRTHHPSLVAGECVHQVYTESSDDNSAKVMPQELKGHRMSRVFVWDAVEISIGMHG